MSDIPAGFLYTAEDEWALVEDHGHLLAVGFTDHGQKALGEITSVAVPRVGVTVAAGEAVCTIEGRLRSTVLHSPATGVITETNLSIAQHPEDLNGSPYSYWLFKLATSDRAEIDNLLSPEAYRGIVDDV